MSQPSVPETQPAASQAEAEAAFRRAHPRYEDTTVLDELRRSDFARLDTGGHVYLDYTGAGLYADSQLSEHLELLRANSRIPLTELWLSKVSRKRSPAWKG